MDNLQSLVLESFVFDGEQTHEDFTTFIKLCSKITIFIFNIIIIMIAMIQ